MYLGPMSGDSIVFHRDSASFDFGGIRLSFQDIGMTLAETIRSQNKFAKIGTAEVTPNYLCAMMNFAVREGWFIDALTERAQDHSFDPNEPTPGPHWGEARSLRKEARDEAALANQYKKSGDRVLAALHERRAANKSREADRAAQRRS